MPIRKKQLRDKSSISSRDIEILQKTIQSGYPWLAHADDTYVPSPLDDRLDILLSHLTGIFGLAVGYPMDPHPSRKTVKSLRKELADDLRAAEKKWGHFVPKAERWDWESLVNPGWSVGSRPLY